MLAILAENIMSFVTRTAYRKDIIAILLIKAIGLFLLWIFFFANPVDVRLTRSQLADRYFDRLA
ncbi:MAG TPA: hypothetical protein VL360_03685 [Gammaproteobacteria bacterium]|jgi:hypothetical protein|nr:hypothetical protein [Gammaproteobacteria bacterium]